MSSAHRKSGVRYKQPNNNNNNKLGPRRPRGRPRKFATMATLPPLDAAAVGDDGEDDVAMVEADNEKL